MNIIHKNLKKGEIKFKIENLNDLWYLNNIIQLGDELQGKTTRKINYGEVGGKTKTEKKVVNLKIITETIELQKNTLRVNGKIIDAPEELGKGNYHSFDLIEGTIAKIIKPKWMNYQLEWFKEAENTKETKILICVMDREKARFALSKKAGYEQLSVLDGEVQKKDERNKFSGKFYQEIINTLEEYVKRHDLQKIVLASPAFFKEDLMKLIKDKELKKRIVLASCSNTGKNGITEVLKRSEVEQILKEDRITQEILVVEEILYEIAKDGPVVYGLKEVKKAKELGAIQMLVVTDKMIQESLLNENSLNELMKSVEGMKGKINIVSNEHDGGKKLSGIGGIAAKLRYKTNYS